VKTEILFQSTHKAKHTGIPMYLRLQQHFLDGDFNHFSMHIKCLDYELSATQKKISASRDPDADGLLDAGEYLVGAGFASIQRYASATYPYLGVAKIDALAVPPVAKGKITVMQAINAGANYWKHLDEWGLRTIVEREKSSLSGASRKTMDIITEITPWADYTCSNVLAELIGASDLNLSRLLPMVWEWRDKLDELYGSKDKQPAVILTITL
jgi:hypothetical protein